MLAGESEQERTEFGDGLASAAKRLPSTGWNTSDVEKYLTDFAAIDVPAERVARAWEIHQSVAGAAGQA